MRFVSNSTTFDVCDKKWISFFAKLFIVKCLLKIAKKKTILWTLLFLSTLLRCRLSEFSVKMDRATVQLCAQFFFQSIARLKKCSDIFVILWEVAQVLDLDLT